MLAAFKRYSKFNQNTFILINATEQGVKIIPGPNVVNVEEKFIPKPGIDEAEFVLNVSDIHGTDINGNQEKVVQGNLKFPSNGLNVSILAENTNGFAPDLRAASTLQEFLAKFHDAFKSKIKLVYCKTSNINGGKWSSINFSNLAYVNEEKLDKFEDCRVQCALPPEEDGSREHV
jgi:hypothetical protein